MAAAQLDTDWPDCKMESAVERSSGHAPANTVAADIVAEETSAGPSAVASVLA